MKKVPIIDVKISDFTQQYSPVLLSDKMIAKQISQLIFNIRKQHIFGNIVITRDRGKMYAIVHAYDKNDVTHLHVLFHNKDKKYLENKWEIKQTTSSNGYEFGGLYNHLTEPGSSAQFIKTINADKWYL